MSEEYKNNITCNGISCAAYKYNHRYAARSCARHVDILIRNKYMHVAKHVHGLIPNSLEAKHVHTHVKSRYICRCHHHPKATFHRTRNRCKREYVLLEAGLHDPQFARSDLGFPNLGIRKLCHAKRFVHMIMWIPTAWTLFSVIRQNT